MLHSAHNSTLLQGVHIDGPRTVQSTAVYKVLKSVQIQRNMTDLVSVVKKIKCVHVNERYMF